MTFKQLEAYDALKTRAARARFLLDLGVVAQSDVLGIGCHIVQRACVGGFELPVVAATEAGAIAAGEAWLRDRMEGLAC